MRGEAHATIQLLGEFGVWIGTADVRPRGRKACAILGVVAASSAKCIRREELAELFWGDRGEEQARSSLRQAVGEIRSCDVGIHGIVTIGRDDVALDKARGATDIDIILDACGRGDMPALGRALDRIGGTFMAGYDGIAPRFDDWLHVERPRNHNRIVSAVLDQAPAMLTREGLANAQTILRALDRLDPYNEVVTRLGMELDHAAGDGASLHRRYRALCEELGREFGAKPAAETRALFNRLTAEATGETVKAEPPTQTQAGFDDRRNRLPPMVLVSPIVASDDDEESAHIAAAATDDIRVALARHGEIRVVALDALDAERMESVCSSAVSAYVLSGKLRRHADGIRANLQLGNIGSSVVVWSDHLRLDRGALDEAIEQIVLKAVGAIAPSIERDYAISHRASIREQEDAAALFAKARYLVRNVRTLGAVTEGITLLERVLKIDQGNVGARLLLAQLYNTDLWQQIAGHDVAAFRSRALALIQEAASIEPDNSRIQVKLAWCYLRRGDWTAAERRLRQACDASPYDADAINECALGFAQLGEIALGIELMQRAFLLNPFPPADYHADYAIMMSLVGDHLGSEEHFDASGDNRLQYVAARMINAAQMGNMRPIASTIRDEFLERFGKAWQPSRGFVEADLLQWLDHTYPFRLPEHQTAWRAAFIRALT